MKFLIPVFAGWLFVHAGAAADDPGRACYVEASRRYDRPDAVLPDPPRYVGRFENIRDSGDGEHANGVAIDLFENAESYSGALFSYNANIEPDRSLLFAAGSGKKELAFRIDAVYRTAFVETGPTLLDVRLDVRLKARTLEVSAHGDAKDVWPLERSSATLRMRPQAEGDAENAWRNYLVMMATDACARHSQHDRRPGRKPRASP